MGAKGKDGESGVERCGSSLWIPTLDIYMHKPDPPFNLWQWRGFAFV